MTTPTELSRPGVSPSVPTPRMRAVVIVSLEVEVTVRPGVRTVRSLMSFTPASCSSLPGREVTTTGTSCRFCSRLWARTLARRAAGPRLRRLAAPARGARNREKRLNLNAFELAAAMLGAVALACAVNARALLLPAAAGLLSLGQAASLAAWAVDRLWPGLGLGSATSALARRLDYPSLVLNLLLGYLLFAGALNVDLKALRRRGWSTAALATLGTVATAAMVAGAVGSAARAFGHPLPFAWALAFGVLISPTDPIAVLAMTKRTDLQEELRAQLEGEALFNDGIAVVLFRAALALAIGQAGGHADAGPLLGHAAIAAFGGAAVGLVGGLLAVGVLALVDVWATETLATVAIATAV